MGFLYKRKRTLNQIKYEKIKINIKYLLFVCNDNHTSSNENKSLVGLKKLN